MNRTASAGLSRAMKWPIPLGRARGALGRVQVHHRSIGWEPRQSGKNLPAVADPDRSRIVELGLRVWPRNAGSSFASLPVGANLETSIWTIA
jgi:hypothetical protein